MRGQVYKPGRQEEKQRKEEIRTDRDKEPEERQRPEMGRKWIKKERYRQVVSQR